jgi:hypothetical protein
LSAFGALPWRSVQGHLDGSVSVPWNVSVYGDVYAFFWKKSRRSIQKKMKMVIEREIYASSYV